jgi:hypothetical protein
MSHDQQAGDQPAKRQTFARLAVTHDRQADELQILIASGELFRNTSEGLGRRLDEPELLGKDPEPSSSGTTV